MCGREGETCELSPGMRPRLDEPPMETERGKKAASKSANENELRWKKASHCIDAFLHVRMHDTTSSAASGTHAYLVKAPRKVLQLRNKPAFQRAN